MCLETIKSRQLNFGHSVLKRIRVPSTLPIFSTLDKAAKFLSVPVQAVEMGVEIGHAIDNADSVPSAVRTICLASSLLKHTNPDNLMLTARIHVDYIYNPFSGSYNSPILCIGEFPKSNCRHNGSVKGKF